MGNVRPWHTLGGGGARSPPPPPSRCFNQSAHHHLPVCSECFTWGINDFGSEFGGRQGCGAGAKPLPDAPQSFRLLPSYHHSQPTLPQPSPFAVLGNGTTSYATEPERVVGLEEVFIADVAAGGWHSMAISAEGGGWGRALGAQQGCLG